MRPYSPPRLDKLVGLVDLAREVGRPHRTFLRQMVSLHNVDLARASGGWLLRIGRRKYFVNRTLLRAQHPELFESKYFTRDESLALDDRVAFLEGRVHDLTRSLNATRARLRAALSQTDLFAPAT